MVILFIIVTILMVTELILEVVFDYLRYRAVVNTLSKISLEIDADYCDSEDKDNNLED
jgi:hypothetical protein